MYVCMYVKSWEKIWRGHLTDLSTSPARCSHFTLGNPKKSFSTALFIQSSDYLRYLKTNCHPLAYPPENVTTLTCVFSSDWRFVAFFQTLEALKRASCGLSSVALERTGCEACQLEWQVSNVTASVHDHASSFFDTVQSHSTPRCACVATRCCRKPQHITNMSSS